MRILDKYILKQMLQPFAFGVAAFSTIFVASSFLFRVTQYITQYGASYSSLFVCSCASCRKSSTTLSP